MKIVSVKPISEYPEKDVKKVGFIKTTYNKLWKIIDKEEKRVFKKYHTAIQTSAISEWIFDRCAFKCDNIYYVHQKKFDKMLKKYGKGKVHSPFDLGFEKINPIMRMMLEGNVSEC